MRIRVVLLGTALAVAVAGPPTVRAEPDAPRPVSVGDLYHLAAGKLYVLNRYNGLQVIDVSTPRSPRLIGREPISGWPREMYVRGTNAFIIASDNSTSWRDALGNAPEPGFYRSELLIVDLANPRDPVTTGMFPLGGHVKSRLVGDVLYVLANTPSDRRQLASFDISDPRNVRQVDEEEIPRTVWTSSWAISDDTAHLVVAGTRTGWRWEASEPDATNLYGFDISDAGGTIHRGGTATIPGSLVDSFSMNLSRGVVRVSSASHWGLRDLQLTTFSITRPGDLVPLGQYVIPGDGHRLTAARFDGDRGLVATWNGRDPLFTFDLTDPMRIVLNSTLDMPGWLDYLVPMGDRVVALGHDAVTNRQGISSKRLAVSLVDNGSARPQLLSRVALRDGWGQLPDVGDDFAKVFKVLPDLGLIVFPFQSWSHIDYRYTGGVQLIDLQRNGLVRRALIPDNGCVRRVALYNDSTLLVLSDEGLQLVDIADRESPYVWARIRLAARRPCV